MDALDTLYIMGLHEEFKDGQEWIEQNLDFGVVCICPTTCSGMSGYCVVPAGAELLCCLLLLGLLNCYD